MGCYSKLTTAFVISPTEGHIDTANPATGVQELRVSVDLNAGLFANVGCFSPDLGVQDVDLSIMSVEVSVSDTGGADYFIVPQAPSQGLLTANVDFSFTGDILVENGGGFQDTGADWTPGVYHNLTLVVNPVGNTIDYYVDDVLIFTTSVFAGTTIEQVVLLSDNFQLDDSGDFDDLIILNNPEDADAVDGRFRVIKDFADDNPAKVEVTLNCFTGLPITQSQSISESQDVNFVVRSYAEGELDCNVTESDVAGYSASYFDGTADSADGCEYTDLGFGQFECVITNTPDPVEVTVFKDWIIEGEGGDYVDPYYRLVLACRGEIVGGFTHGPSGIWRKELYSGSFLGTSDAEFNADVVPYWDGGTVCWVLETVYDSSVEVNNTCGSNQFPGLVVELAGGDSCTVVNTVFFEGIPTLSQYDMAILALLLLGVGFVGFRRFV